MMNIILWIFAKLVKIVAPYYDPHAPQPVGSSDWPEDPYLPGLWGDWNCPEDSVYDDQRPTYGRYDAPWVDAVALDSLDGYDDGLIETTTEWGLQLPNGEVYWGSWSNISFSTPLDRMRMIATLQKTALDMGLNANGQSDEFLNKYKWQTREATARIRYKNSGSFSLNDPAVSAAPVENSNHEHPQDDSEDTRIYSYSNLHPGSVGGDA